MPVQYKLASVESLTVSELYTKHFKMGCVWYAIDYNPHLLPQCAPYIATDVTYISRACAGFELFM